jgi:hypothetical protein
LRNGRTVDERSVTGFGTEDDAQNWIDQDAAQWLDGLHRGDPK